MYPGYAAGRGNLEWTIDSEKRIDFAKNNENFGVHESFAELCPVFEHSLNGLRLCLREFGNF
jgi:hypothetical protein